MAFSRSNKTILLMAKKRFLKNKSEKKILKMAKARLGRVVVFLMSCLCLSSTFNGQNKTATAKTRKFHSSFPDFQLDVSKISSFSVSFSKVVSTWLVQTQYPSIVISYFCSTILHSAQVS